MTRVSTDIDLTRNYNFHPVDLLTKLQTESETNDTFKPKSQNSLTKSVHDLNKGLNIDFLKASRINPDNLNSRKEDEVILKTDVREILMLTAKALRIVEHSANMCFNSKSKKLKITTSDEIINYMAKMK